MRVRDARSPQRRCWHDRGHRRAPCPRAESGGAPKKPWVVAHRGASAYAPENTIPAFALAAQQGATFVEFDLQLTKDKRVVCLHDNSLERTTDVEQVFPDRARTNGGSAHLDARGLHARRGQAPRRRRLVRREVPRHAHPHVRRDHRRAARQDRPVHRGEVTGAALHQHLASTGRSPATRTASPVSRYADSCCHECTGDQEVRRSGVFSCKLSNS